MATGPVAADSANDLPSDFHALRRRCIESEAKVERLTEELAAAQSYIASLEARVSSGGREALSLFEGGEDSGGPLNGDGSDPRILSFVLAATAVVTGMVALLTLINHQLFHPFGLVMIAATIGLAWASARTHVDPIEVSVVRGVVYVKQGESTHRFDVRNPSTVVEQVGRPGDASWELRFARRGMDPYVIKASMVDAPEFVARLREWRPEL